MLVSNDTVSQYRVKVKSIINDPYEPGTHYVLPVTMCRECTLFDPKNIINMYYQHIM